MTADDATINAVAAALYQRSVKGELLGSRAFYPDEWRTVVRPVLEVLAEAGWLRDPADRADIERLREQVTAFANEIVQMHQDRDEYDTALEAQLNEARDGLDERDRIIIERDNEIAHLRADRLLTPTDQAVLDAADLLVRAREAVGEAAAARLLSGGSWEAQHAAEARAEPLWDEFEAAVLARRAAVGGSVPADPKEQP